MNIEESINHFKVCPVCSSELETYQSSPIIQRLCGKGPHPHFQINANSTSKEIYFFYSKIENMGAFYCYQLTNKKWDIRYHKNFNLNIEKYKIIFSLEELLMLLKMKR